MLSVTPEGGIPTEEASSPIEVSPSTGEKVFQGVLEDQMLIQHACDDRNLWISRALD